MQSNNNINFNKGMRKCWLKRPFFSLGVNREVFKTRDKKRQLLFSNIYAKGS